MAARGEGRTRWVALLIAVLTITPALGVDPVRAETPTVPREAIEQVIREYLLNHPEVIVNRARRAP